jgi:peptidylprolyl isomerase/peptidyl-prolyl cis-trans isomerase B (cyclophilin B)
VNELLNGFQKVEPLAAERKTRFTGAEHVIEAGKEYRAVVTTNKGAMVLELFSDQAPNTVNNFVFLTLNGYYDGIVFHRVLEDFMAQTGDPTGTGTGGPGYTFADEFHPELSHDGAGVLSMANAGPGPRGEGTNGSQFFITFAATPWLDGKHSVFGRVIDGAEVLGKIQRVDPGRRGGPQPDKMEGVEIYAR